MKRKLLALALAVLIAIPLAAAPVSADSAAAQPAAPTVAPNAAGGTKIRIGMVYGSGVSSDYNTFMTSGVTIGAQSLTDSARSFTTKYAIHFSTELIVACDGNLVKSGSDYVPTSATSGVSLGGYHVEMQYNYATAGELATVYTNLTSTLSSAGLYPIPCYINGKLRLRIGNYSTLSAAQTAVGTVSKLVPDRSFITASPSANGVCVISPSNGRILFEFSDASTVLGFAPMSAGTYLKTPAGSIYEGVFAYKRYASGSTNGISVINVVPIERYVAGVIPHEVFTSWSTETLRAIAVAVRSYALGGLNTYNAQYGFDITKSSQVYGGASGITSSVEAAVSATAGQVVAYNGKVATAYYSSSMGNCTAGSGDVWLTSLGYAAAVKTPWERYTSFTNGLWTAEVSPSTLLTYLRGKGYTTLTGSIASISITAYAANSTYVKTIKYTDTSGKSVTVDKCANVVSSLGAYVKSANFVVGKSSVAYKKDTVTILNEYETSPSAASVITKNGKDSFSTYGFSVITGGGVLTSQGDKVYVRSDSGTNTISAAQSSHLKYTVSTQTLTATAKTAGNFIFVGKGWGHGVGMSQYGCRDLGALGWTYPEILKAYFTGVYVTDYYSL